MKLMRVMVTAGALASVCACSGTKAGPDQATAGAGTAGQAPPVSRIANPCKLLTQTEASEAIGTKLEAGELKRFGGVTRCSFYNKRDSDREVFLDVQNESAPNPDSVEFD